MGSMVSQITTISIVCSVVHQSKHQSSALLAFCEGNPPMMLTKGQWLGKCFHVMTSTCGDKTSPMEYSNVLNFLKDLYFHYNDVIMTTIASQITSLTVVCSTVYSDADQRKHQSSASLAFVRGIHRDRWIPRTKGQLRGKCFHLMTSSCSFRYGYQVQFACYRPITADLCVSNVAWQPLPEVLFW